LSRVCNSDREWNQPVRISEEGRQGPLDRECPRRSPCSSIRSVIAMSAAVGRLSLHRPLHSPTLKRLQAGRGPEVAVFTLHRVDDVVLGIALFQLRLWCRRFFKLDRLRRLLVGAISIRSAGMLLTSTSTTSDR